MAASCTTFCVSWHRKMRFSAIAGTLACTLAVAGCDATTGIVSGEPDEVTVELSEEAKVVDLSTAELNALIANGNIRLIDVRRDDEVAEGMIPGAEHIMLDDFDPAQLDLSDGREVVLYCRSGRRSGIAAERLAAHTGEPVKHLDGGIMAWQEAGLELEVPAAD